MNERLSTPLAGATLAILLALLASSGPTQLNDPCTVKVLNCTTTPACGGEWRLANVPSNLDLVWARATFTENCATRFGSSALFAVTSERPAPASRSRSMIRLAHPRWAEVDGELRVHIVDKGMSADVLRARSNKERK